MLEIFEKIILAGAGLMSMTRDKAEQLVDTLVEKGQVEAKDRHAMLSRLLKGTEKLDKELEKKMQAVALNVVKNSEKQIDALHKKIAQLSGEMQKVKKAGTKTGRKKQKKS